MEQLESVLKNFILEAPLIHVFIYSTLSFVFLYFGWALFATWMSKKVLPFFKIGRVVNHQKLFQGQIAWEIQHSLVSIFLFGAYGFLTAWLIRIEFLSVKFELPSWWIFSLELFAFVIWNGIHFYAIHRTLHAPILYKKIHWVHHRSKVCTPFGTYSFHWVEALALGSVMFLAMNFYEFHLIVLLIFPAISLAINTIGHWNYSILPDRPYQNFASATKRHAGHHHFTHGNFGFLAPTLDQLFKTTLKPHQEELP